MNVPIMTELVRNEFLEDMYQLPIGTLGGRSDNRLIEPSNNPMFIHTQTFYGYQSEDYEFSLVTLDDLADDMSNLIPVYTSLEYAE